jgi:3-hydroxyisobutyrate dehydrogenase-like beta-hydroxyacid dehydrogenase
MPNPTPIGFIGLGNMGAPMAANLLKAGSPLTVYNRTAPKAQPLAEQGATVARTPIELAQRSQITVTVLADDRAVESVIDESFLRACPSGAIHLSMSTILPATAARLAESHAKHNIAYVAAPVFGRPDAAAAKKLWIVTSGPADAKTRVRPVLDALGQGVFDFGDAPGAANVVKLAGNFLIMSAIEAMAEASALVEKNDVPRAAFLEFLTHNLFNAPIYKNYGQKIIRADFDNVGFALPLGFKDTRLVLETATASHTPMPLLNLLRDRYASAIANNRGHLDASALALGAALDAGLTWFDFGPH